ncbi:MAG TPA: hypothetical protein VH913_12025 [Hyphomicrobiaceae bacterium]|jgi:hypothetical protein
MGGHPYWYVVPYESDIDAALQKLKLREFEAGRYNPVIPFLEFPIGPNSPSPGRRHASIEEAIESTEADGTRSILDMIRGVLPDPYNVENVPVMGVSPLSESDRIAFFGDARPSREAVEKFGPLWERLERGTAIYVVLYANGEPNEIYFAGISFD